MNGFLWAAVGLLLVGLALFWAAGLLRRRAGIPGGRVVYSDTRAWRECPDPLYAPSVNLRGKPDYLVQKLRYVIPVEIKSGPAPDEPYRSHVLQLAAYCLLVEQEYEQRPPYASRIRGTPTVWPTLPAVCQTHLPSMQPPRHPRKNQSLAGANPALGGPAHPDHMVEPPYLSSCVFPYLL